MTVRLIAFTFAVLSLANAYSFVRIYSSTTTSSPRVIASAKSRLPASIAPVRAVNVVDTNSHLAVDLNCGAENKNMTKTLAKKMTGIKVNGQWTQLKGKMCGRDKLKQVEITNLSNGFTASVFATGTQQYQTDLIQLKEGVNRIRVRITPEKGSVEEQTVVVDSHHI